jgi:hypothetical protein
MKEDKMYKAWIRFEVCTTEAHAFLVFVVHDEDGKLLSTGSTYIHGGQTDECVALVEAHKKIGLPVEVIYYGNAEHKYDYLENAD